MRFILCISLAWILCAKAQDSPEFLSKTSSSKAASKQRFQTLIFTTEAYQAEVVCHIIKEANDVAIKLALEESIPIAQSNLIALFVPPPHLAQRIGALGSITTSNYTYYVSVANKFSFLEQAGAKENYAVLQKKYLWPIGQIDINAAYQLATQWLASVSMDVLALNSNCVVHIDAFIPEGPHGKHFVPLYWIYWMPRDGNGSGPAATVELLLPTKTLRQLRVNRSEYILRPPLVISNLDFLLSQTNALAVTNAPAEK